MNRFRRQLGKKLSEGQRLVWVALHERQWGFAELSRALKKERGIVNKWLYGDRRPDIESAARIEEVLGIPSRLWAKPCAPARIERVLPPLANSVLTPDERAAMPRAATA